MSNNQYLTNTQYATKINVFEFDGDKAGEYCNKSQPIPSQYQFLNIWNYSIFRVWIYDLEGRQIAEVPAKSTNYFNTRIGAPSRDAFFRIVWDSDYQIADYARYNVTGSFFKIVASDVPLLEPVSLLNDILSMAQTNNTSNMIDNGVKVNNFPNPANTPLPDKLDNIQTMLFWFVPEDQITTFDLSNVLPEFILKSGISKKTEYVKIVIPKNSTPTYKPIYIKPKQFYYSNLLDGIDVSNRAEIIGHYEQFNLDVVLKSLVEKMFINAVNMTYNFNKAEVLEWDTWLFDILPKTFYSIMAGISFTNIRLFKTDKGNMIEGKHLYDEYQFGDFNFMDVNNILQGYDNNLLNKQTFDFFVSTDSNYPLVIFDVTGCIKFIKFSPTTLTGEGLWDDVLTLKPTLYRYNVLDSIVQNKQDFNELLPFTKESYTNWLTTSNSGVAISYNSTFNTDYNSEDFKYFYNIYTTTILSDLGIDSAVDPSQFPNLLSIFDNLINPNRVITTEGQFVTTNSYDRLSLYLLPKLQKFLSNYYFPTNNCAAKPTNMLKIEYAHKDKGNNWSYPNITYKTDITSPQVIVSKDEAKCGLLFIYQNNRLHCYLAYLNNDKYKLYDDIPNYHVFIANTNCKINDLLINVGGILNNSNVIGPTNYTLSLNVFCDGIVGHEDIDLDNCLYKASEARFINVGTFYNEGLLFVYTKLRGYARQHVAEASGSTASIRVDNFKYMLTPHANPI